jgi:ferredoxin
VIEVLEGLENLSEFTPEERDFLGEPQHERLACQCKMRCGSVRIKY